MAFAPDLIAQKARKLAGWCVKSEAMKSISPYNEQEWESLFLLWPEKGLDDLALVLKEELEMNLQVDEQEARKLKVNDTRLAHKLQKIRFEAETLSNSFHGNA